MEVQWIYRNWINVRCSGGDARELLRSTFFFALQIPLILNSEVETRNVHFLLYPKLSLILDFPFVILNIFSHSIQSLKDHEDA